MHTLSSSFSYPLEEFNDLVSNEALVETPKGSREVYYPFVTSWPHHFCAASFSTQQPGNLGAL